MLMNIQKIENILQKSDLFDLYSIQETVNHLVREAEANDDRPGQRAGVENRKEKRFKFDIMGTLVRLTDVKPGERKEYSVHILDLSRGGLCLEVDPSFIPSRLVEIIFNRPGKSIKRCNVEVVRIRKRSNENGSWLELGCRSASSVLVRRLRLQEQQVLKARHKLQNRKNILIILIGANTKETKELEELLNKKEYHVRQYPSGQQGFESARKMSASLIILCQGSQFARDKSLLAEMEQKPQQTATLAIVEKEEHRFPLYRAGVDECLTRESCEDFFLHGIERAIITHTVCQAEPKLDSSLAALVLSRESARINQITYFLEENGYVCRVVSSLERALKIKKNFTVVFADFDGDLDGLAEVRSAFPQTKLIVLCDEIKLGYQAVANGANNYLTMPPHEENIRMVLEGCKELV